MESFLLLAEELQWRPLELLVLQTHDRCFEPFCQRLLVHAETFGSLFLEDDPYPKEKKNEEKERKI